MARYYNPAVGRYLQSDPIGLSGGINSYAYVLNDPLSFVDPQGLMGQASGAQGGPRSSSPQPMCGPNCQCWLTCMVDDQLLPELLPGLGAPLFGLKTPSQIRPGASAWGSIDRRFPWLPGADPSWGPEVRRAGKIQRVKCLGTYGTAAGSMAAFTAGYSAVAATRCWLECN